MSNLINTHTHALNLVYCMYNMYFLNNVYEYYNFIFLIKTRAYFPNLEPGLFLVLKKANAIPGISKP